MSSLSQGIHNAVCIGIIFTGKHQSFNRPLPKVTILWEITENEKIKTFSRDYTYSYYEKAELRLHLESWRGRPFTATELSKFKLRNILGVPCKLEIAKNNKITNKQKMFTVFQQRNKLLNANQSLFTLIYQIKRLIQKYLIYHIIQQKRSKTHLSINNRHLNYNITKHIGHSSVMLSVFFYTRKEKHHEY